MKIALIGYGKMGRMIEETARQRGHEIVSIIDVDNQQDFDSDAFRSADVAIEFTTPKSAYDNYLKAWAQGVKVVSGSTGWMAEHGDEVKKACAEGKTLFWASNFSIGVAIFSAVNRYLAKIMNNFPQYDVTMEETHHIHKLDHPSGTAVTLAEEIIKNIDRKTESIPPHGREAKKRFFRVNHPSRREGQGVGCFLFILTARVKSPASIVSATTAMPTKSPSPTTPIRARALRSVPSWQRSSRKTTRVC